MKIAEKLYSQGFISYPRTETNIFPKELNLTPLVTDQTQHPNWGEFASRVLNEGITPRQGKKSDQAHPPIHPIKFTNTLQGVYTHIIYLNLILNSINLFVISVHFQEMKQKFTSTLYDTFSRVYPKMLKATKQL